MNKKQFLLILSLIFSCSVYAEDSEDHAKSDVSMKIAFQLQQAGNYEQAKEYYQRAIELNPDNYKATANLGLLYAQEGEWNEAIEYYNKTIELIPYDWRCYYNLGVAYNNTGNKEKALMQVVMLRSLKENERADDLKELIDSGEIADEEPRF